MEPTVIEARCSNCAMWQEAQQGPVEIGKRRGICTALPPTPFPRYDPTGRTIVAQGHLRPTPMEHEACGMFAPHPRLLETAANDGM